MAEARPYAVLFDLDGTLVDSIALLLASMRHTFEGRPRQPSDAEWIEGLGTPLPKQLTPYIESDEDRERLLNRYRTFQIENHDQLMAHYEGVIDTLALLYQRGHPM
jgi:pyrophosphatase PpaX